MGIKKSIKKIVDSFIPKDKPTPISGGNSYETAVALEVQKQLDLQSMQMGNYQNSLSGITGIIRDLTNKFVDSKNITEYVLLNYQANYFCGTCRFKTEDMHLKRMVLNVIRGAFLFGCAGIYVNGQDLTAYYVTSMEYDFNGKLTRAKVFELELMLSNMNKLQREPNTENLVYKTIEGPECEKLAVFQ